MNNISRARRSVNKQSAHMSKSRKSPATESARSRAGFLQFLSESKTRVDRILKKRLAASREPRRLSASMRYAVFGGGKRLRPGLVYLGCRAFGGDPESVDGAAAAVELIHTYSLVHDDLPCMDDDDLRRGRPTVHIKFDEAMAVLAGDALHTEAFAMIVEASNPKDVAAMVSTLAAAAGPAGMVGGQVLDLNAEGKTPREDLVRKIHLGKTASLIAASLELGAIGAGATQSQRKAIAEFGIEVGVAFQVADDVLDMTGDATTLGKTPGKDVAARKMTFPAAVGLNEARKTADRLARKAQQLARALRSPAEALLLELPCFVTERTS